MTEIEEIIATCRVMTEDHQPDGWPAVQMKTITALCDEVERLRRDNEHQRERRNAARDAIEKGKAERKAIEQERDQLKDQLYKYGCEDVDVIRCLKTMAYEHNHPDVPRYKDLAKRTMDKYVERCTTVGSALAQHDAEVIETWLKRLPISNRAVRLSDVRKSAQEYANQLRQQAKEVQS